MEDLADVLRGRGVFVLVCVVVLGAGKSLDMELVYSVMNEGFGIPKGHRL